MTRSKWICSILLFIWAFFTANLSQRVALFPDEVEAKKKSTHGTTLRSAKDSLDAEHKNGLPLTKESFRTTFVVSAGQPKTVSY